MYVRPEIKGKPLTFGVSGKLWKDSLVMYDRETQSLWSHVTGSAIVGKLKGMKLTMIPALHTTWAEWKALHPKSQVLDKRSRFGLTGTHNVYAGYVRGPQLGIFGTTNPDARLPGKEFVIGLDRSGARMAYPFRHLSRVPLVNDVVAGEPIAVVFARESATGTIFSRRIAGLVLTFRNLRREGTGLFMEDAEIGTIWNALTGEAVRGKLAGTRLEQVPATLAFWFAWKQIYPDTAFWEPSP